jgi:hypothetical protein
MSERAWKLPVWARKEIELLERRLAEAEAELDRINANEPSRIHVDPHAAMIGRGRGVVYVPNDRTVRYFPTSDSNFWVDVRLGRRNDDIAVEIMAAGPVAIELNSSNVFQIVEARR